jgi:hypothetical protein
MSNNTDTTEGGRVGQVPLAAHIAAIMNDPATPAMIYNGLLDALGELQSDRMKRPTASFIAAVLAQQQERQPDGPSNAPAKTLPGVASNEYMPGTSEAEWCISDAEAGAIMDFLLSEGLSSAQPALKHLLVLLRALVYTRDIVEREGVFLAVRTLALPYLEETEAAFEEMCAATLAAVRGA